jgi:hypothetical protein
MKILPALIEKKYTFHVDLQIVLIFLLKLNVFKV